MPSAPIGLGVPYGYRTTHVWSGDLSGQKVQDVVVASAGPPVTAFGFHSADIRVLLWDPLAHEWSVAFDAQKVYPQLAFEDPGTSNDSPGLGYEGPSTAPILDPKADVGLGNVRLVHLLSGRRDQLAFDASMNYGGSGVPDVLAVVDFKGGLANLAYAWTGEGLMGWSVHNGVLRARLPDRPVQVLRREWEVRRRRDERQSAMARRDRPRAQPGRGTGWGPASHRLHR